MINSYVDEPHQARFLRLLQTATIARLRFVDAAAADGLVDVLCDIADGGAGALCAGGRCGAAVCCLRRQHDDAAVDDRLPVAPCRLRRAAARPTGKARGLEPRISAFA